jgi:hypothetical protein
MKPNVLRRLHAEALAFKKAGPGAARLHELGRRTRVACECRAVAVSPPVILEAI